jgi:tRNA U34 5-methylaminomethyl-2-thiouridine-forming methyltransferase MnmC
VGQRSLIIPTKDGSHTLFSTNYNQHYHNVDDGAIQEALYKHVIPALSFHANKTQLRILDICFGLGYNTFATLYYILENRLNIQVAIYSPELDEKLIQSLQNFTYPKEFEPLAPIIESLLTHHSYEDKQFKIELFIGNAREYVKELSNIDIVYQDAFSSEVNRELWSVEYFNDIYALCNETAIVTTYAIATPIRLSMFEAGFEIYEHIPTKRKITLGFKQKQSTIGKFIDMELKKQRNPTAKAINDQN